MTQYNKPNDASASGEQQGNKSFSSKTSVKSTARTKKSPSAFRTISEVAEELDVQQHVLRFWETKFTQVKPLKRGGGRRYYRPEDVELLKTIHNLLYTQGYTIKGVQKLLKGQGKQQIISGQLASKAANEGNAATQTQAVADASGESSLSTKQRSILNAMLGDLKDLRDMIRGNEDE